MNSGYRALLTFCAITALAVVAVGFAFSRINGFRKTGEESAKVWFYNLASKRLYAAARDVIPPDGNGVRAIVVAYPGEEADPAKRKIAYLEKYTPELKRLLEQLKARRPMTEKIPTRDSQYFQDNTLVSSVTESDWHPVNSVEGKTTTSAWRSWVGPGGERPIVCIP